MYTSWDIETTIKQHFKRKASPFTDLNWVVTHAFKKKGGTVEEYRFGDRRPQPGWLRPVLAGTRLLVGFNIKFDLLHALQDADNLDAWMEYVAAGGNVWDCQLAEYLLCGLGQKDQMLSLDEVAPRYGGNVKVDEVKALWAAGIDTHLIDPELLSRYLCGGKDEHGVDQLGDVENTEKIALAQIQRARDCKQLNSILLNMGSLLCTIEMERNGMFVDMNLGLRLAAELKVEVDRLHTALQAYLPHDLPFAFNWNSPKQKSALIFGGTVHWDGHEYDTAACAVGGEPITIFKHVFEAMPEAQRPKLLYSQMDVECAEVAVEHLLYEAGQIIPLEVARRENIAVVRYSSGKREGEIKSKKVKFDNPEKPKGRATKVPYTFKRITEPKKAWASAEPGFWSTNSDVIEELAVRNIPFLKALSALQSASKDLGTYFIVTDPETGESKGMLSLVDQHGIIHHSINHTSTVTARFSSSNPNLQNIPKGNKSKVKLVFVSRFGRWVTDDQGTVVRVADGVIIQSDFTALEIYVQAILTQCKQLIEDLKAGLDMHVLRLSNSPAGEGKSYEELLILCKGDKKTGAQPVDEWDYKRTDSKVYSFQAAYGAGDTKIADTTGMDISMVAALRAADEARYPEITKYFERRTAEIKLNRKPTGNTVPHPDVPGVFCPLGTSSVRTPDGKLYSYQENPSPEYLVKKGIYASFSPTEIKNYEVQGEGGEWAKAAMWLAIRAFYKRKNFDGLALLVNQVHDALYADAHNKVAQEAAILLHACMESASDFMEWQFNWIVPVPVPSETSMGLSMMDDKVVPGIKELASKLREELRQEYMQGYKPSFI
jgi:DNA polymerase-1